MDGEDKVPTTPDPKDEEAWMVELGFRKDHISKAEPRAYVWEGNSMFINVSQATFFYTICHTALTSFRDEVVEQAIGENETPDWDDEYNMCNTCEFERTDDSKDCLCRIRNKLRERQRKAIQTISERHGI